MWEKKGGGGVLNAAVIIPGRIASHSIIAFSASLDSTRASVGVVSSYENSIISLMFRNFLPAPSHLLWRKWHLIYFLSHTDNILGCGCGDFHRRREINQRSIRPRLSSRHISCSRILLFYFCWLHFAAIVFYGIEQPLPRLPSLVTSCDIYGGLQ